MVNGYYGELFREARERLSLRQVEIADILGIASCSISSRENGRIWFKTIELYKAYKLLCIDIGFGYIFDYIDTEDKDIRQLSKYFSEEEVNLIMKKDYNKISLYILEKLKKIVPQRKALKYYIASQITDTEMTRLNNVLEKYLKKDGNIQRGLKLLEIAIK